MNSQNKGFTLVEILIVVVLLGILAAIVIPQFSNASEDARFSAAVDNLRRVRTQVELYRHHHGGIVAPGYPPGGGAPNEATFVDQMTLASDVDGATAAPGTPGFIYGPYLQQIPVNPFNGLRTIQVIADGVAVPAAATGTFGWIYKPETADFRVDAVGQDDSGHNFYDY